MLLERSLVFRASISKASRLVVSKKFDVQRHLNVQINLRLLIVCFLHGVSRLVLRVVRLQTFHNKVLVWVRTLLLMPSNYRIHVFHDLDLLARGRLEIICLETQWRKHTAASEILHSRPTQTQQCGEHEEGQFTQLLPPSFKVCSLQNLFAEPVWYR